eukprot:9497286-Pyramimonas_sp.AAC.1
MSRRIRASRLPPIPRRNRLPREQPNPKQLLLHNSIHRVRFALLRGDLSVTHVRARSGTAANIGGVMGMMQGGGGAGHTCEALVARRL